MKQTETKINETIVTGRRFRKLVDPETKNWTRISGWVKTSDITKESILNTSGIIEGKTFPNCNYKGRVAEFKKPNKPFHNATLISEDN